MQQPCLTSLPTYPAGGVASTLTTPGIFSFPASTKPCAHRRGLWVLGEDVRCRDCDTILGSVWDEEYEQDAFDGFDEAYYGECDHIPEREHPHMLDWEE